MCGAPREEEAVPAVPRQELLPITEDMETYALYHEPTNLTEGTILHYKKLVSGGRESTHSNRFALLSEMAEMHFLFSLIEDLEHRYTFEFETLEYGFAFLHLEEAQRTQLFATMQKFFGSVLEAHPEIAYIRTQSAVTNYSAQEIDACRDVLAETFPELTQTQTKNTHPGSAIFSLYDERLHKDFLTHSMSSHLAMQARTRLFAREITKVLGDAFVLYVGPEDSNELMWVKRRERK